jgi:hypothetical protein
MTLQPIPPAERHRPGTPETHMIALCTQPGNDLHTMGNGG